MHNPAVLAPLISRVNRSFCWVRQPGELPGRRDFPIDDEIIAGHLAGRYSIGACPITPGTSTTRCAVLDLDSHKGDVPWIVMLTHAHDLADALAEKHIAATPFKSSGGMGLHLVMLWEKPQDAYTVREELRIALGKCNLRSGTGGIVKGEVEIFPKQDSVPADGFGSMFILPLSGKSRALLLDGDWIDTAPGNIQWRMSDDLETRVKPVSTSRGVHAAADHPILEAALAAIPNEGGAELAYDDWRNIIFAIHSATDGDDTGLALAHRFSERSSKHNPEFLESRVWPYITERDGGITVQSLFNRASAHGWLDPAIQDAFPVLQPDPTSADTLDKANDTLAGQAAPRFRVQRVSEFKQHRAGGWIIKKVLPQAELAVVFGPSGSGKTFFVLDLVASVVRGVEWRGNKVTQGRAVYICAEGVGGFRNRVVAYLEAHGLDDLEMGVIPDAPNFMKTEDIVDVLAAVRAFGKVSVIVVDTFAQVMPGANENAGEDVGKAIYHCKQIHKQTGALVVLVHHSGKNPDKGARGWSGIKAALDCEIEIARCEDDRSATITKLKDGKEGTEFGFRLRVIDMGIDDDLDMITSCVVETADAPATPREKRAPLGSVEKIVQRAVHDLAGMDGCDPGTEAVIDRAVEKMPHDPGVKRDTRRQHALRALTALSQRGYVVVEKGACRLPDDAGL